MPKTVNKFSIRQTITNFVVENKDYFNTSPADSMENDQDLSWSELVQACIYPAGIGRPQFNIPDLSISDSDVSSKSCVKEIENLLAESLSNDGRATNEETLEAIELENGSEVEPEADQEEQNEINGEDRNDEAEVAHETDEEGEDDHDVTLTPQVYLSENEENQNEIENELASPQDEPKFHEKESIKSPSKNASQSDPDELLKNDGIQFFESQSHNSHENKVTNKETNSDEEDAVETGRDAPLSAETCEQLITPLDELIRKSPQTFNSKSTKKPLLTTLIEKLPDSPSMFNPRCKNSHSQRESSRHLSSTPLMQTPIQSKKSSSKTTTPKITPQVSSSQLSSHKGSSNKSSKQAFKSPASVNGSNQKRNSLNSSTLSKRVTRSSSNASFTTVITSDVNSLNASDCNSSSASSESIKKTPKNSTVDKFDEIVKSLSSNRCEPIKTIKLTPGVKLNESFDSDMSVPDNDYFSPTPSEKSVGNNSMRSNANSSKLGKSARKVNQEIEDAAEKHDDSLIEAPAEFEEFAELEPPKKVVKKKQKQVKKQGIVYENTTGRPRRALAGRRLEGWRGEHPIYEPTEDGTYIVKGVTKPSTPDILKRKLPLRPNNQKRQKKSTTIKEDSADTSNYKLCPLTDTFIEKSDNARQKFSDIVKSIDDLNWRPTKACDKVFLALQSRDKDNGIASGYLKLCGICEKPSQKTSTYSTCLTLIKGHVSIKINDEPCMIVKKLETVIIPSQTTYSINNLHEGESLFHLSLST